MSLDKNFIKNNIEDLCASIQYTLIEILMLKINSASKKQELLKLLLEVELQLILN